MKALLAKRSHRKSIGVLVNERDVSVCVMAATPLGKEVLFEESEPRAAGTLNEQFDRLLGPWISGRPRPKVVIGVPAVRVFHSAREVGSSARKDPEVWLQESLATTSTRIDDMVIDVADVAVGKKSMAGLVSCRRRYLTDTLESLKRFSARVVLAEPTPCALLRLAASQLKAPRGSKLSARFLLGERQALAILTAGGVPLHWRTFDLPTGEEPLSIHAALVGLRMHVRSWKIDAAIDAVLIHGRPELASRLDATDLTGRFGVKVARADGPTYESRSVAQGLALAALVEERGFDLSRTFKPPESIAEIFPWADLVMQSAMLVGIVVLMSERARTLENEHAAVLASMAKIDWLGSRNEGDLEKEKKTLEQKQKTAEAFLASRVNWSNYLCDVASHMPNTSRMTSLTGMGELENLGGKGGPGLVKKTFVMRLETPIPSSGATPQEVDRLLESLRDKSLLKREFPVIELKDLKSVKGPGKGTEAVASYSIVCLPPASKVGSSKKD